MTEVTPRDVSPGQLADHLFIRLFELLYTPIDARWNARDVRSSFWRLYINNRDGAGLELDDGYYPLAAGRAHLVPAWVHFHCRNCATVEHFYIHFDVVGLPPGVVREVFASPITLSPDDALEAAGQAVVARLPRGRPADLAAYCHAKALVYRAFAAALDTLPPEAARRCQRLVIGDHPFRAALAHIEEHLADRLAIADLARLCHLSEDHFIRRFRESVGQTPGQYVMERRIAAAAQRLLFTSDTIDKIAQDTGFANRFYFSRVFNRVMRMPPAAYRAAERV